MTAGSSQERRTLARLSSVEMEAVVELGRIELPLSEVRSLRVGDVLVQSNQIEHIDLKINDILFARGEITNVYRTRHFRVDELVAIEPEG